MERDGRFDLSPYPERTDWASGWNATPGPTLGIDTDKRTGPFGSHISSGWVARHRRTSYLSISVVHEPRTFSGCGQLPAGLLAAAPKRLRRAASWETSYSRAWRGRPIRRMPPGVRSGEVTPSSVLTRRSGTRQHDHTSARPKLGRGFEVAEANSVLSYARRTRPLRPGSQSPTPFPIPETAAPRRRKPDTSTRPPLPRACPFAALPPCPTAAACQKA
ncbi:hypothetical protein SAMN05216566_11543 [Aureimonas phyllosphaerae]|uniref:Uncharacterized protein n=1 Tax=Aureimonas phyllosphaerae TaxID=1166078 RepID=A0A7W6C348_9HYPH|nr:hypothetical protein [Aureimonas phyllosphaerae]MBB3961628.1 hypothetical protein [Aureimonas phyllosphaerae]SFF46507.1 hypothetical protein SAMN05216566_11543 [Aureimonas phyllosphaerae]